MGDCPYTCQNQDPHGERDLAGDGDWRRLLRSHGNSSRLNGLTLLLSSPEALVSSRFFFPQLVDISQQRLHTGQKSGHVKPPKLDFIYCSGVQVHGSSKKPINDLLPAGTPGAPAPASPTVSWKPDVERLTLAATDALCVLIIHPALSCGELPTSGRYCSHPPWPQSEPEIAV